VSTSGAECHRKGYLRDIILAVYRRIERMLSEMLPSDNECVGVCMPAISRQDVRTSSPQAKDQRAVHPHASMVNASDVYESEKALVAEG
jgi:hypothetical protein